MYKGVGSINWNISSWTLIWNFYVTFNLYDKYKVWQNDLSGLELDFKKKKAKKVIFTLRKDTICHCFIIVMTILKIILSKCFPSWVIHTWSSEVLTNYRLWYCCNFMSKSSVCLQSTFKDLSFSGISKGKSSPCQLGL